MEKKIAPSEQKAQAFRALFQGQRERAKWGGVLSRLVRLLDGADIARSVRRGTSGGVRARTV